VRGLIGETPETCPSGDGTAGLVCEGTGRFLLVRADIPRAAELGAERFTEIVAETYRAIGAELTRQRRHAVRIWNFVPDIQGQVDGVDRYHAFNTGRFRAYCDWFGDAQAFAASLPTASAVGVQGSDLSIHVLAADTPGRPLENPRQRPAYRYSRQYGLRPPCFSRATRIDALLLMGGTASILGQDSQHGSDLDGQVRETLSNLAALIGAGGPARRCDPLRSIRSLRVYVREARDAPDVRWLLDTHVPEIADVELAQAALCRPELLVEIEGVAAI
jgi:enamine deaminase RidA (YjgF/YER057c/UK114 family)